MFYFSFFIIDQDVVHDGFQNSYNVHVNGERREERIYVYL